MECHRPLCYHKEKEDYAMHFPEDMTFQYFFFATYPGYFLQTIPIALLAGLVVYRFRRTRRTPAAEALGAALFASYLAGLVSLTLAFHLVSDLWYFLLYRAASGSHHSWLTFEFYLVPDFFRRFGSESLGNILLYLPFGILFPLARRGSSWRKTVVAGILTSLTIEVLQPFVGRSFDINDIILNTLGVLLSASVFSAISACLHRH